MDEATLSTLYIKLAAGAALLASILGTYFYISHLREKVTSLETQVMDLGTDLALSQEQVRSIAESKAAIEARQQEAEEVNAKLRGDLARARGRVQTIKIPSDCPAALDWLAEELKS